MKKSSMNSHLCLKLVPWTNVSLATSLLGQMSLGQKCPWTTVPWTTVATFSGLVCGYFYFTDSVALQAVREFPWQFGPKSSNLVFFRTVGP